MVQEIPPPTILLLDYQSLLFRPESIFARLQNDEELHICHTVIETLTNLVQKRDIYLENLARRALVKIEELKEHPKVVIQSEEQADLVYAFNHSVNEASNFEDKIIANFWFLLWTGGKPVKLVTLDGVIRSRAAREGVDLFDIQDLVGVEALTVSSHD